MLHSPIARRSSMTGGTTRPGEAAGLSKTAPTASSRHWSAECVPQQHPIKRSTSVSHVRRPSTILNSACAAAAFSRRMKMKRSVASAGTSRSARTEGMKRGITVHGRQRHIEASWRVMPRTRQAVPLRGGRPRCTSLTHCTSESTTPARPAHLGDSSGVDQGRDVGQGKWSCSGALGMPPSPPRFDRL